MQNPNRNESGVFDVVVVGGGPAGLSAAYWLGRYRRRVRLYDVGEWRNRVARAVHGFPGVPDVPPAELYERMHAQAIGAGAELRSGRVVAISGEKDDFLVHVAGERPARARRILLAYGVRDVVPDIPGLAEAYGTTVHHCPDCDGPDVIGKAVGVIGWSRAAAGLALFLLTWAERVTLLGNGAAARLDRAIHDSLDRYGVAIHNAPITRVDQCAGRVCAIELEGGERLPLEHLFFHIGTRPGSGLGEKLGCGVDENDGLIVDQGQETTTPGVYAAGDVVGHPHLVASAAADGIKAALAMHRSLLPADFEFRGRMD